MKNIIELARSRGSTATTQAGARRYLLAHLPGTIRGLTHADDFVQMRAKLGGDVFAVRADFLISHVSPELRARAERAASVAMQRGA